MAEQVAHQTAERSGEDGRNWTPQPQWLDRCVQYDHDADDREGGKRDGVEHFDQVSAQTWARLQIFQMIVVENSLGIRACAGCLLSFQTTAN